MKVFRKKDSISKIKELDNVNIMIIGKTGTGKSTLINNIFRENIAETGKGRPVTQHMIKLSKEGVPISLYDTKGLELDGSVQKTIKSEIIDEIRKCNDVFINGNKNNCLIDICWYCIDARKGRCEETDKEWINDISKEIPVIVVLTKSFPKRTAIEFKAEIEKLNLNYKNVIPILAEEYVDDDLVISSYGLDTLVEETLRFLPEGAKQAFSNAQRISIKSKVELSRKWLTAYVSGSSLIGLSPIPFSDAPLLAASQLAMITHITKIFGLPINKGFLTALIGSVTGISGATIIGKTVVSNVLKFIPGVGTVAGATISASVAGVMTTALGMAYINVLKYVLEEENEGRKVSADSIVEILKKEFEKEINEYYKKKVKSKAN